MSDGAVQWRFPEPVAAEIAALQPLLYGCRRLVMVGDPQQLPATLFSATAKDTLLERSLFERLAQAGTAVKMLSVQYRMHPPGAGPGAGRWRRRQRGRRRTQVRGARTAFAEVDDLPHQAAPKTLRPASAYMTAPRPPATSLPLFNRPGAGCCARSCECWLKRFSDVELYSSSGVAVLKAEWLFWSCIEMPV
ncbi:putative helicase MAGATAMA 3 [Tetrabaena socialis]|uniref:Putative helicase MAGATAMA 3 n=1 Tax=Tetrabaena socialis TaxID=47790 RepID=A0A2J7ZZF1_9CHLO|nr:putative helicase MAGATAMA 3 [Tetrabaena socialis]|eukprot:PNH05626.1 putative helicase MAGATAMA 3 [Tetrabaena socialis]